MAAPKTVFDLETLLIDEGTTALQEVGHEFHQRGWSLGTSSNYSVIVSRDPMRLLITASGHDKGRLKPSDFVVVDEGGRVVSESNGRPSAETGLHLLLARRPEVGAVLHTHSPWGTIWSGTVPAGQDLAIEGYEMLKGLSGVTTHEHRELIPVFANQQHIPTMANEVEQRLSRSDDRSHGFLIARHGLYTWGRDVADARRHVEVFEFLFETMGLMGRTARS